MGCFILRTAGDRGNERVKFNFNCLWDLDEMSYNKQLEDGDCNGDNYFQISIATLIIRISIRGLNALDFYLSS